MRRHHILPRRVLAFAAALGLAVLTVGPAVAVTGLVLSTPFPAVVVAPNTSVSFDLTIAVTTRRDVGLAVRGAPTGWDATLRGGGNVIDGVTATPASSPAVRLDVKVPADAKPATYPMSVVATADGLTETLPISVRVNESAAGSVTLTSDFPSLQGPTSTTFRFTTTLTNDTSEDLTFALTSQGPAGWDVTATPSSQSQAASVPVKAGASETVSVEAKPTTTAEAGAYPISVRADAGARNASIDLEVDITGTFSMSLTTPTGQLNASGNAGSAITSVITVQNTGTGPLAGVKPTATAPQGWTVTFAPETVDVAANSTQDVTSTIVPAANAIAGDYVVTYRAATADASTSATTDIRVTIETSLQWALIGIALILVVIAVLGWIFARYGRR